MLINLAVKFKSWWPCVGYTWSRQKCTQREVLCVDKFEPTSGRMPVIFGVNPLAGAHRTERLLFVEALPREKKSIVDVFIQGTLLRTHVQARSTR